MNSGLMKNLKKYAAASTLLISAFMPTSVQAAQSEALFLFRSPAASIPAPGGGCPIPA